MVLAHDTAQHLGVRNPFGLTRFQDVYRIRVMTLFQGLARPREIFSSPFFDSLLLQATPSER